jgi:ribosomal protein S21
MIVNAEVLLEPGDDATAAWKKLHKLLMVTGTYTAARRHDSYRKPSEAARIKSAKARRRDRKAAKKISLWEQSHGLEKIQYRQDGTPIPRGPRPGVKPAYRDADRGGVVPITEAIDSARVAKCSSPVSTKEEK